MRQASAAFRLLAPLIAVGVLAVGCGQSPTTTPSIPTRSAAPGPAATAAAGKPLGQVPSPGPTDLPVGSLYKNPANNRNEVVLADVRHTAILIGDSQAMPKDSWPQQGIAALGYKLHVVGMGGTGYVASNGKTGNYIDALQRGDWVLPYGEPPLIVVEGGGNDATQKFYRRPDHQQRGPPPGGADQEVPRGQARNDRNPGTRCHQRGRPTHRS